MENINVNKAINAGDSIKVDMLKYFSSEGESYKNVVYFTSFSEFSSLFSQ